MADLELMAVSGCNGHNVCSWWIRLCLTPRLFVAAGEQEEEVEDEGYLVYVCVCKGQLQHLLE